MASLLASTKLYANIKCDVTSCFISTFEAYDSHD